MHRTAERRSTLPSLQWVAGAEVPVRSAAVRFRPPVPAGASGMELEGRHVIPVEEYGRNS